MGAKKVQITIDEAVYNELKRAAIKEGFGTISTLVRHLAISNMRVTAEQTCDRRILKVPVENYKELSHFIKAKSLGSIEVFACYAMAQHMLRYPLSGAQKKIFEESITD